MSLTDKISIKLEVGTISILLSGLYIYYTGVNGNAIPPSLYVEVAEELVPYLKEWDYDKVSFEEWIRTSLIIAPKVMFDDEELKEMSQAEIFLERRYGNADLVVCGRIGR